MAVDLVIISVVILSLRGCQSLAKVVHLTANPGVASSNPGLTTLLIEIYHKIISAPSADSRRAVVCY